MSGERKHVCDTAAATAAAAADAAAADDDDDDDDGFRDRRTAQSSMFVTLTSNL